jgi:TPR repeat protein
MDWYRKAADKGVAQAMHNLGVLYRDGLGVSRNYDSALYWYGRAVDAGRTKSRESIQALVRDGHVREADAARWLK